jgi:phage terminase large subunit
MSFRDLLAADIAREEDEQARALPAFTLPNNWEPRSYQEPLLRFLTNGGKRACLVWRRRSGKDDLALNWAAVASQERVGDYWHMLPEQSQARKAIWDAVNPHTGVRRIDLPIEMRAITREAEMMIRMKNGSTWRLVGSDNYNSLVGSSIAGCTFSEWALADPRADAFIRPMLTESGGWVLYITTPRGRNHAFKTLEMARKDSR